MYFQSKIGSHVLRIKPVVRGADYKVKLGDGRKLRFTQVSHYSALGKAMLCTVISRHDGRRWVPQRVEFDMDVLTAHIIHAHLLMDGWDL